MAKIISGINDLYTTNPELVHLLLNPEESHTISIHSHKRTDFKCDYCGSIIRNCIVRNVFRYGLRCPICSDNISFGEKIISNLLSQLNVDYEYDKTTSWSNNRRYDFIIKSHSLIIETHGLQHYKDVNFHNNSKTLKDEQENDLYKKQLAIKNNISHYVEINTSKYNFKFIKQFILESELNDLFDLSNIDWTKLFYSVNNSKVREVCDLWNSGIKNIDELANIVKISPSSVRHYLSRCNSAGLCYYSTDMRKKVICVDNGKIYDSLNDVGKDGFNISQVSACCHNKAKTSGGYNWCYLEDYNPDTFVMNECSWNGTPKRVMWIEKQFIYDKLVDVKKDGFSPSCVSQCCNGKKKHHRHQHFKFV